jgi:hypothetical protein
VTEGGRPVKALIADQKLVAAFPANFVRAVEG